MSAKRIPFFFLILFSLTFADSFSQNASVSPYSRYGIGDIPFGAFAKNNGFGGLGIAYRAPFTINIINPASYSAIALTTFDMGASVAFTKFSTTTLEQKKSDATFSYFALGFPVMKNKWGAALGLVPFSNVGYKIFAPQTDTISGDVLFSYEGSGGLNRLFIGNSVALFKNFSAGVNASYLFGSLKRISRVEFFGSNFLNSRFTESTTIGDFYFNFGLQYVVDSLRITRSDSLVMYDANRKELKRKLKDTLQTMKEINGLLNNANERLRKFNNTKINLEKKISEIGQRIKLVDSLKSAVSQDSLVIIYEQQRSELQKNLDTSKSVLTSINDSINNLNTNILIKLKTDYEGLEKRRLTLRHQIEQSDSARKEVKVRRKRGDWSLTTGFNFSLPTNLSAEKTLLAERYLSSSILVFVKDTAESIEGEKGTINIPYSIGFGFAFTKGNKWMIGADAAMQNWQDFSSFGQSDALKNSFRINAGAQFIPDERAMQSYWQSVQYRFGMFYDQTYLQLKSTQLNEFGVTFGLGFPVRKGLSMIQISAQLGRRGTTDNNLIQEDFARFTLGFTFNDRWFIKPKFD